MSVIWSSSVDSQVKNIFDPCVTTKLASIQKHHLAPKSGIIRILFISNSSETSNNNSMPKSSCKNDEHAGVPIRIGIVSMRLDMDWNLPNVLFPMLAMTKAWQVFNRWRHIIRDNGGHYFEARLEKRHVRIGALRSCGRLRTPQYHQEQSLALEVVLFSWIGASVYVSVAI